MDGTLFFTANDGASGKELWKSDGTSVGTVRIKDILIGSRSSSIRYLTNVGGTLYFRANDGTNGDELWKSDGTNAGTLLVDDITGDSGSSSPLSIVEANGHLFVVAMNESNGRELWVADLNPAPSLPGDYNENGTVDAADYVIWRATLGSTTDLRANGDNTGDSEGVIDQADYNVWRSNFGNTLPVLGAGAAVAAGAKLLAAGSGSEVVPSSESAEPAAEPAPVVAAAGANVLGNLQLPVVERGRRPVHRPLGRKASPVDAALGRVDSLLALTERSANKYSALSSLLERGLTPGSETVDPSAVDHVFADIEDAIQFAVVARCKVPSSAGKRR